MKQLYSSAIKNKTILITGGTGSFGHQMVRTLRYILSIFLISEKSIWFIILLYSIVTLSIISWGTSNLNHPFPYHMDEWHQLQAVRALFKHGSPNVSGAAHGPIFQFFLSGIFLVPFIISGIVNPFLIKSSLSALDMQQKFFIILRLNTLLFGVLSIIVLARIAKQYLKINPVYPVLLFVVTPVWFSLSNFFKYDIALTFWIILSLYFFFTYSQNPSVKNYVIAGVCSALALATKISALPIIPIYIIVFFLFTPKFQKSWKTLWIGLLVFSMIFILFGIPDMIFKWRDYFDYFYSNVVSNPSEHGNYILPLPLWAYMIFSLIPVVFGHFIYLIFVITVFYWFVELGLAKFAPTKSIKKLKVEMFLLICILLFTVSLFPLRLGATGNRLLVLLPFLSLTSGLFIKQVMRNLRVSVKLTVTMFIVLIILQILELAPVVYTKYSKSTNERASEWISNHIPQKTIIGIENIPIYQMLPDVIVKEFYSKQYNRNTRTAFEYQVISSTTKNLPRIIVLTGTNLHVRYLKKSDQKDLVARMSREGYKKIAEFKPNTALYFLFRNDLNYFISGLNVTTQITVYELP